MRKTKKKSRFAFPLLALVVCLVIVTGSTFSLFTSETGANIAITSGSVKMTANIVEDSLTLLSKDVEQNLVQENVHYFENGGTAAFNEEFTKLTLTNITPGDKVEFTIALTNASNVNIQYRVNWAVNETVAEGETVKLSDVLVAKAGTVNIEESTPTWTEWKKPVDLADRLETINVSIEFPMGLEGVDYNSYMNKTLEIDFTVEAVQANAIQDINVSTADELYVALAMDGVAILENDIVLERPLSISTDKTAEIYLAGHTITNANGDAIVNNGNLTIYSGAPVATYSLRSTEEVAVGSIVSGNGSAIVNNGTLTINGGSFKGTEAAVSNTTEQTVLLINEGSFESDAEGFAIEYVKPETVTIVNAVISGTVENNEDLSVMLGEDVVAKEDGNGNLVFAPVTATVVTTSEELLAAFAASKPGDVIDATGVELAFNGELHIPAGITLMGAKISCASSAYLMTSGNGADGDVIFENCEFVGPGFGSFVIGASEATASDLVFNNCNLYGQIMPNFYAKADGVATFNNCTFGVSPSDNIGLVNCMGGTHIFNGCTFNYAGGATFGSNQFVRWNAVNSYSENYKTSVTLSGCTLINCGTQRFQTVSGNSTLVVK